MIMGYVDKRILSVMFVDEQEWQEIGLCYVDAIEEKFGLIIVNLCSGATEFFKSDRLKRIQLAEKEWK